MELRISLAMPGRSSQEHCHQADTPRFTTHKQPRADLEGEKGRIPPSPKDDGPSARNPSPKTMAL